MPVTDWFDYPYNYSNGTAEVEGLGNFIQYGNLQAGHWVASGFVLIIWILTFFASMVVGSRKALMVSSFISFLLSIYFVRLQMIPLYIPITLIIMTIIGALGSSKSQY